MQLATDTGFHVDTSETDRIRVTHGGTTVADYVFRPGTDASEAPKPYLHPIRTLGGTVSTIFRPSDHRWHKGLTMTLSEVSGQNFWGGPTFDPTAPPPGYVWRDNIGRQQHDELAVDSEEDASVTIHERLTWITASGVPWISEQRTLRFSHADHARDLWVLDFDSALTNVVEHDLILGSPTTLGRPDAGYTGLFWRGPRSWAGAPFDQPEGVDGPAMGSQSAWLAVGGESDEVDGSATLVFTTVSTSDDPAPTWFARADPYAVVAASPAFSMTRTLPPASTLTLQHRVLVLGGRPDHGTLTSLAAEFRR